MSTSRHLISLETAKKFTKDFRDKKKKILKDEYGNKNTIPLSETFDRDAFDYILSQQGCVGIRVYFGMNTEERVNLIIVGVNDKNEDIVAAQTETGDVVMMRTSDTDPIAEQGDTCPPSCPPPSGL